MNKYLVTPRTKSKPVKNESNSELVSFVAHQFKQLAKKHLRVPIQLYTL